MIRKAMFGLAVVAALVVSAPLASAQNWTGFYAGGSLGYVDGESETTDLDAWNDPGDRWDVDLDGATLGAQAGYDWQVAGNWRVGVAGEVAFSDVDGEARTEASVDTVAAVEVQGYAFARVRGGYVWGENNFAYATLGAGFVQVDAENYDRETSPGTGLMEGSDDDLVSAWTIGLGYERQINERLSVGGEWQHVSADEVTVTSIQGVATEFNFDNEVEFDVFRVTLNWAL